MGEIVVQQAIQNIISHLPLLLINPAPMMLKIQMEIQIEMKIQIQIHRIQDNVHFSYISCLACTSMMLQIDCQARGRGARQSNRRSQQIKCLLRVMIHTYLTLL